MNHDATELERAAGTNQREVATFKDGKVPKEEEADSWRSIGEIARKIVEECWK